MLLPWPPPIRPTPAPPCNTSAPNTQHAHTHKNPSHPARTSPRMRTPCQHPLPPPCPSTHPLTRLPFLPAPPPCTQTNFTSLATPSVVGSCRTALVTLLHEGGHAAHFANITQPSPFFSREGAPLPWALIEAHKRATHPYSVFALRGMLAVPFFERALYETPEAELSVERVLALADRIKNEVQGGLLL